MREWMKEVALLLRIQAYRFCGINMLLHGQDKKQKRRAMGQMGVALLLCMIAALYSGMFMFALCEMGLMALAPHVLALAAAAITLGVIVLKGPWLIFGGLDVPMLRAMPVRTSAIVISRLIGILLPEAALALLMGVSSGVVLAFCGMPAFEAAALAPALCFSPAIPTALALLAGTAIAHVTIRMRHRAAISAALSILLVLSVVMGATLLGFGAGTGSMTEAAFLIMMGRIMQLLEGIYPPADWMARAAQGSAMDWMLLAGTALLAIGLLTAAASLGFTRISDGLLAGGKTRDGKGKTIRPVRPIVSLYKKEWLRFTSSSIYLMNTSVGWLILLAAAAALYIVDVRPYLPLVQLVPVIGGEALSLLPIIPAMIAGMAPLTACAISIEGKHIEQMRALPVRMRDWLGAKLLLHMTFAVPSIVVSCALAAHRLGLHAAQAALMIAYPLLWAVFTGVFGLAMNLRFPRFDWNEEAQVVKNGIAVLLTMLVGILLPLGVGALGVGLGHVQAVILGACIAEAAAACLIWRRLICCRIPA